MSETDLLVYDNADGFRRAPWKLQDGRVIELIQPRELAALPSGTMLIDIMGETAIVGTDTIDNDTRGGMLAYGLLR